MTDHRSIPVTDLRVGDQLYFPPRRQHGEPKPRLVKVTSIEACAGMWRTHIHVNKTDCHDGRFAMVEVAL